MAESRRIANRYLKTIAKDVSNLDVHMISSRESDRSLLIHEDKEYDVISEENDAASEFLDKDIPDDKREIINNPNYFKQLSLSFYGAGQPSQKSTLRHLTSNSVTKTEPSKPTGGSLSPRANKDYFQAWRKSPILINDKDPFNLTHNTFSSIDKKTDQNSMSYSRLGTSQVLLKNRESIKRDNKNTTAGFNKDLKAYKVNVLRLSTTSNRATPVYPQLASSINIGYSSTPKNGDILAKAATFNAPLQIEGRPSLRILTNNKPRPPAKGYVLNEPSSAQVKTSTTSTSVPKKLQMYAQENTNITSLKGFLAGEGRAHMTRKNSKEAFPARSAIVKNMTGYLPKRPVLINTGKLIKKHGFYE